MSQQRSLEEYKNKTRKWKSKVRWLHEKNQELILKLAQLKSKKREFDTKKLINYSVNINNKVTKIQVSLNTTTNPLL